MGRSTAPHRVSGGAKSSDRWRMEGTRTERGVREAWPGEQARPYPGANCRAPIMWRQGQKQAYPGPPAHEELG